MNIPVIAFFNNKGGVGKTSLVYHVAWMMSDLGIRVVAADLDPQGNLSSAFLDDDRLEELWPEPPQLATIYGAVRPLQRGVGDLSEPHMEQLDDNLALILGDMGLSRFEDDLSQVWPKCLDRDERSFRVISAFWRVLQKGASQHRAQVILVDLGPNLGAINRSALIASDYVVIPLGPDLYSLQGLRNLGPALREWRQGWQDRLEKNPDPALVLPTGRMQPLGYIVMTHSIRTGQPVKAYEKWISRIPVTYRHAVLNLEDEAALTADVDPNCFALLKHYRSLMPMAQEVRKPIFHLKPADGAIGSHFGGVQDAGQDFRKLTHKILDQAGIF
ncbi:MAG: ParA family protein [Magnetococcales bacterium]|nr:ParA family protein [Magnetococcales bacterium]MBF0114657.1 ParA family protein [Magnetococcales bacterium]